MQGAHLAGQDEAGEINLCACTWKLKILDSRLRWIYFLSLKPVSVNVVCHGWEVPGVCASSEVFCYMFFSARVLSVVLFWLDVSLFFPAVVFWLFCLQSRQPARLTVLTYACATSCLLRFLKSGFLGENEALCHLSIGRAFYALNLHLAFDGHRREREGDYRASYTVWNSWPLCGWHCVHSLKHPCGGCTLPGTDRASHKVLVVAELWCLFHAAVCGSLTGFVASLLPKEGKGVLDDHPRNNICSGLLYLGKKEYMTLVVIYGYSLGGGNILASWNEVDSEVETCNLTQARPLEPCSLYPTSSIDWVSPGDICVSSTTGN